MSRKSFQFLGFITLFIITGLLETKGEKLDIGLHKVLLKYGSNIYFRDTFWQKKCLEKIIYETLTVTIGKESFPSPLKFIIENDTLRVINNDKTKPFDEDLIFKIKEKICTWNTDFTIGQSEYKLLIDIGDGIIEYPTLKIIVEGKNGQMTMQYPNEKPRIFDMVINATKL